MDSKDLIDQTNVVRDIITLASRIRNENQLPVKQPLKTMYVCALDEVKTAINLFEDTIKDELNIKEIELSSDVETFNDHYLILNFRNAGRVLKGDVQKMKEALENTSDDKMQEYVNAYDNGKVKVDGFEEFDSELFVKNSKPKQEFILESENGMTVVLDTTLTPELINEGILREIIRNAQVLRKEANFEIDDRIMINITSTDENITNILKSNAKNIKNHIGSNCKLCAVVKANAYGIGLETVCKSLYGIADFFAVAFLVPVAPVVFLVAVFFTALSFFVVTV